VAIVVGAASLSTSSDQGERPGIVAQIHGTAYRPYVYRQLLPLFERALLTLVPARSLERAISRS
jgi:hypothetical protein